jgi:hypothetical protein
LIEAWALRFGAADFVCIFVDDLESTLRGQAAQIVELSLRVLVHRGNPQV